MQFSIAETIDFCFDTRSFWSREVGNHHPNRLGWKKKIRSGLGIHIRSRVPISRAIQLLTPEIQVGGNGSVPPHFYMSLQRTFNHTVGLKGLSQGNADLLDWPTGLDRPQSLSQYRSVLLKSPKSAILAQEYRVSRGWRSPRLKTIVCGVLNSVRGVG